MEPDDLGSSAALHWPEPQLPHHDPDTADDAQAAVTALYRAHAVGLIRLAYVMLGDRPAAEDVVQDAFCGLYRRWDQLEDPAGALAYVRSSVLNGCRTALRRRALGQRVTAYQPPAGPDEAEAAVLSREERQEVMRAVRRLPDRQREALVLRFYLDLPDPEIARVMGNGHRGVVAGPLAYRSGVTPRLTSLSPGAGCACKLPLAKLEAMFATMDAIAPARGDLLIGAAEADDAAVLRLDDERALVLTTDFFTPIVDDPGDWGAIAAANALSDVYAMGGRPLFAVNLAAWPADGLDIALLGQVLQGGARVAAQAGCVIAGGHTIDDPVPKYGLAVVGLADPAALLTIDRAAPGDRLILTKPVGTGVIATAVKRGAPHPEVVEAAVASMTALNAEASQAALAAAVKAATDVTGFGLLGHLHRMLAASGVAATVTATAVPLLPGARDLAAAGFVSGGTRANTARISPFTNLDPAIPDDLAVLLYDAQTSGGLLLAVPAASAGTLLADLQARGLPAALIGEVTAGEPGHIDVLP